MLLSLCLYLCLADQLSFLRPILHTAPPPPPPPPGGAPVITSDFSQVSAADKALHGPFLELPPSEVQTFFLSKYWGAYFCAHYGAKALNKGGSITLFSGMTLRYSREEGRDSVWTIL